MGFLSVQPAVINGYLTFFRAGESEGGEEEEWLVTSVTPLSGTSRPLPNPIIGYGNVYIFIVRVYVHIWRLVKINGIIMQGRSVTIA